MSHSVIIVNNSLLEIFDPTLPEYGGVRDHFTLDELENIDEWRLRPHPTKYTTMERIGIIAALSKAILTAKNEI